MKVKIHLLSILCFYCLYARAQEKQSGDNFTLSGKVTGRDTGVIKLYYTDANGKSIKDTGNLKNGTFLFEGVINGPIKALIVGDTKSRSAGDPNFGMIFLSPGNMTISLHENDFRDATMTGSPMQADMEELRHEKTQNLRAEDTLISESISVNKALKNGGNVAALKIKMDSISKEYLALSEEDKIVDCAFIKTHPDSYLSPYLVRNYFPDNGLSLDSAAMFYNLFSFAVKNSAEGKYLNNQATGIRNSMVGMPAPEFKRMDIDGEMISLSSFKGKNYVLLDFWASWCGPCRAGMPHLKKVYQRYHANGLEVIGLSWDTDEKKWKDALNKDSTGMWHNIFADPNLPNDNGLTLKYATSSIPMLILIDKNGVIVGRWNGQDADVYADMDKKMAEVMGGK